MGAKQTPFLAHQRPRPKRYRTYPVRKPRARVRRVIFSGSRGVFSPGRGVSPVPRRIFDRDGCSGDRREGFSGCGIRFSESAEGFREPENRIRGSEPGFRTRKWNSGVSKPLSRVGKPLRWPGRGAAGIRKTNSRPGMSIRSPEIEFLSQQRGRGTQKMEFAVQLLGR